MHGAPLKNGIMYASRIPKAHLSFIFGVQFICAVMEQYVPGHVGSNEVNPSFYSVILGNVYMLVLGRQGRREEGRDQRQFKDTLNQPKYIF